MSAKLANMFIVVGDDDSEPQVVEGVDRAQLLAALHAALQKAKTGYCYLFLDGQRCELSQPKEVYEVKLPDGTCAAVSGGPAYAYHANGRFSVLRAVS